jgi:hypothetical protein
MGHHVGYPTVVVNLWLSYSQFQGLRETQLFLERCFIKSTRRVCNLYLGYLLHTLIYSLKSEQYPPPDYAHLKATQRSRNYPFHVCKINFATLPIY